MPPPLTVAIIQPRMRATVAENLPGIVAEVTEAAAAGAGLIVLPECATTGFHRGLPDQCVGHALTDAAAVLRRLCDQLGVAAVVGSPWRHDGGVLNAALVLRPGCVPLVAPKEGLTDSERRFFTPAPRAAPWTFRGWRLATALCREVADIDALLAAYAGRIDALIWPGYIAWDSGELDDDAARLARSLRVEVVQCNWPESLNAPGAHRMGRSRWIGSDGRIRAEGPPGVGRVCWTLGEDSLSPTPC